MQESRKWNFLKKRLTKARTCFDQKARNRYDAIKQFLKSSKLCGDNKIREELIS